LREIYQLIATLSLILPQLNETKLNLEYLKSGFKLKNKDNGTDAKNFASFVFDFFRVQLKLAFKTTAVKL